MDAHLNRRWRIAALALVGAGLLLGAASRSLASEPRRGGRLVASLRSEPRHFNPFASVDRPTQLVLRLLMADLIRIDRDTHRTHGNLAKSWSVSEDGRTFEIELPRGVRFSDGHPMSADDVVFSFEAHLDERTGSPQSDLLRVGGEPIAVKKLDDYRVRFELAEPYAAGERLFDSFYVLPRHVLEDARRRGALTESWPLMAEPSDVVGLGPFRLKQVVPGERIVLERNPYYWKKDEAGRQLPYLDELVLEIVPAEQTELLRLRQGELHIVEGLTPEAFETLSSAPPIQARDLGAGFEYNLLVFNLNELGEGAGENAARRQSWFRDSRFRRAVSLGIDRRSIVRLVFHGRGAPLATHVTPGNAGWIAPELRPDAYSVEAAQRELGAAGYRLDGGGRLVDAEGAPVRFSILTSASNEARKRMAAVVQEDLARLGIEVNVVNLEFRSFVDRIFQAKDYDACLLGLGGADADPNPEMSLLLSSGAMHVWRLGASSPLGEWQAKIDRLMTAQMSELDPSRRREMYFRVQELVAEHVPFVSLVSPHVLVAHDVRVGNLRPGVLPPYTLWNAEYLYVTPMGAGRE